MPRFAATFRKSDSEVPGTTDIEDRGEKPKTVERPFAKRHEHRNSIVAREQALGHLKKQRGLSRPGRGNENEVI